MKIWAKKRRTSQNDTQQVVDEIESKLEDITSIRNVCDLFSRCSILQSSTNSIMCSGPSFCVQAAVPAKYTCWVAKTSSGYG